MGILMKLGWRKLRTDRTKTGLTIVAMTIAATLAVASLVGLRSFQQSFYRYQLAQTNGMLVAFPETSAKKAAVLANDAALEKSLMYVDGGRLMLNGTADDLDGTRLTMSVVTNAGAKTLKPQLTAGRMPQAPDEVLMADTLVNAHNKVGATLKPTVAGKRQTYRVVGTINAYAGGYIANSGLIRVVKTLPAGKTIVLATPKSTWHVQSRLQAVAKAHGLQAAKVVFNTQALALMFGNEAQSGSAALVRLVVVAVILVVIGSVALIMIYTSINLSVRASRQRYGLLRSIGTTPSQIRRLVIQEALLLVIPAILLGMGVGIGGLAAAIHWMNRVLAGNELPIHLYLQIDAVPLIAVVAFMAVVTLLAAARPALRAARVTPIAAIRALEPNVKLTKRKLRVTWSIKHTKQPVLRLAQILARRQGNAVTQTLLLTVTVMLFVGLTGFVNSIWRVYAQPVQADLTAQIAYRGDQTAAMRELVVKQPAVAKSVVGHNGLIGLKDNPAFDARLFVLPDAQFKQHYGSQATMLNTKVPTTDADTKKTTMAWYLTKKPPVLTLTRGDKQTKQTLKLPVRYQTLATDPVFGGLLPDQGLAVLVVSQTQFQRLDAALKLPATTIPSYLAVKLTKPSAHKQVVAALKARFGQISIYDNVAENQQSQAITMVIRATAYGFMALLALVSLATVINHTFVNLTNARRGMAQLQALGTTPKQVLAIQAWQYGGLFTRGWVLGSGLGVLLSTGLSRLMMANTVGIAIVWPWAQVIVCGLTLILVGGSFTLATWRMLNRQNIEQLLRSE